MSFKFEFQLKQTTPLVHFQYNQKGATLRATEVKPKLDRFIINHYFNNVFDDFKTYLVGYSLDNEKELKKRHIKEGFMALDYKLTISGVDTPEDFYLYSSDAFRKMKDGTQRKYNVRYSMDELDGDILYGTPYFADNSRLEKLDLDGGVEKKGVFQENPLFLKIFSFHPNLIEIIKKEVILFFFIENFGCRNSKGFGCYAVRPLIPNVGEYIFSEYINEMKSSGFINQVFEIGEIKNFEAAFKRIAEEWRLIKAGRNDGRSPYAKSLLFQYGCSRNIRWDKRWIKHGLTASGIKLLKRRESIDFLQPVDFRLDHNYVNNANDTTIYDYRYLRAMLGLAELYEFQLNPSGKMQVKVKMEGVERFRSPTVFKYYNGVLYLLILGDKYWGAVSFFNEMFNKDVHFTKGSTNLRVNGVDSLKTPSSTEFNLADFFNFVAAQRNYTPL